MRSYDREKGRNEEEKSNILSLSFNLEKKTKKKVHAIEWAVSIKGNKNLISNRSFSLSCPVCIDSNNQSSSSSTRRLSLSLYKQEFIKIIIKSTRISKAKTSSSSQRKETIFPLNI